MKFDTVKSLVLLAGAAFVGWKVYQANKLASDAVDVVTDTAGDINQARKEVGAWIGGGIYDLLN